MARKSTEGDACLLEGSRLRRLSIKNFQCIGEHEVVVDLDDIVILIGENNVGKSTILDAYEFIMGNPDKPNIQQYHKEELSNNPEIVLDTVLGDNTPGESWIFEEDGHKLVRERWIWPNELSERIRREGWDPTSGEFVGEVPWGAPNVAKSGRPEPIRLRPFDSPEKQAHILQDYVAKAILNQIKGDEESSSPRSELLEKLRTYEEQLIASAQSDIDQLSEKLSDAVSSIFPGQTVKFQFPDPDPEKAISFVSNPPILRIGAEDGHQGMEAKQGSGTRRSLIWIVARLAQEFPDLKRSRSSKKGESSASTASLLLLDEPELCLHPSAVRHVRESLYSIADTPGWQVMITTHHPSLISLEKDNTTIVRVEKRADGKISGTTIFRSDRMQFSDDDRESLRALNVFNPHLAEMFFARQTLIVEGDTEVTVLREMFKKVGVNDNILVVNAGGKSTIPLLIRLLTHFGAPFTVLHDLDQEEAVNGRANPAWTANNSIKDAVEEARSKVRVKHTVAYKNLEQALFEESITNDKPYNALRKLRDPAIEEKARRLALFLSYYPGMEVPEGFHEWDQAETLEDVFKKADGGR